MAPFCMQPERASTVLRLEGIVHNHPQKGSQLIESDYLGEAGNINENDQ